jgi:hypothetical protein
MLPQSRKPRPTTADSTLTALSGVSVLESAGHRLTQQNQKPLLLCIQSFSSVVEGRPKMSFLCG